MLCNLFGSCVHAKPLPETPIASMEYRVNTGDPNSRWYSMDGTTWGDLAETSSGGNKNDYSFMIRACFNAAEAVDQIQGDKVQSTKLIRDGQLLIELNGKTYNAQGAEVR